MKKPVPGLHALAACTLCMTAATTAAAPGGDAEIFAEKLTDETRYAGVFPDKVKTIVCISPASYPGNPSHRRAVALLKKAGYKVKIMPHAFEEAEPGKTGAPLAHRLEDLQQDVLARRGQEALDELRALQDRIRSRVVDFAKDQEADMILCIRGGRGCEELLAHLDWSKLSPRPDLYVQGYSDVTLLTAALRGKGFGHPVAGPMAGSMSGLRAPYIRAMKEMYHGKRVGPFKLKALVPGDCAGLPLSGLLERLTRVSRADYRPDTAGRIIFIEVVGSKPALIREHLQELVDRKFFAGAAGVVFCQFIRSGEKAEIDAVLKEFAPKFGVPVYTGFPFGHSPDCCTIDFRRKAVIENGKLVFP